MKKLFLLFIVLLMAIGLGFLIHKDPGYAMVSYNHWVIATSIWVAGGCVLLAFIIFYFLMRFIITIFTIPKMLARRRQFLNAKKYRQYMMLGIALRASGDPKKIAKANQYFLKLKKCGLISDEELQQINTKIAFC